MKMTVASSPHIRGNFRTSRLMMDVVLALLPALIVGTGVLGVRSLLVVLVSVVCAVASEWLYSLVTRTRNTTIDGSAMVTGVLLAMTLPHTVPLWMPAVGSVFAILIVKALCGGLGQNIFNPALAARAFLMLIYPVGLTRFEGVDGVSGATPLHHMVMPSLPEESILDMFLGNCAGCIGEISALALLAGGAYLIWRKVISIRIPAAYLGTVAVLTLIFFKADAPVEWMLYSLLSGGVILGAIFMATDYATSPATPVGQIIYGIGCGVLTVIFRYFGLYPEGVTYAILLMNALVWVVDRFTAPRRFGEKNALGSFITSLRSCSIPGRESGKVSKGIVIPVAAIVICAGVLFAAAAGLNGLANKNAQEEHLRIMKTLVPGSENFVVEPYTGEDTNIRSVHKGETGFVVETVTQGYADEITMLIGVSNEGTVTGLVVREMHETFGLGGNALTDWEFLRQFLKNTGDAEVGTNVDAISGATVTSKAIARSVNSAAAVVTGTDASSSATSWGG